MKLSKLSILCIAMLTFSSYAHSNETYTIEAGFEYAKYSGDDSSSEKTTGFGGTYYLKPVTLDSSQPYAELDFIQRASDITITYANVSVENTTFTKTTISPLGLSGNFYFNNFIIGLNNKSWSKNFNLKEDTNYSYKKDRKISEYNLGYFVTPNTSVSFSKTNDISTETPSSALLDIYNPTKIKTNSLYSHTVTTAGDGKYIVLDLNYDKIQTDYDTSEKNKEYGVKIRYYPENNYFVEGGYFSNTGEKVSDKGKSTLIGAGYAINPRLSLSVTYYKFDGSVSSVFSENSGYKFTSITAGYRF
jgi:hypothetical protein